MPQHGRWLPPSSGLEAWPWSWLEDGWGGRHGWRDAAGDRPEHGAGAKGGGAGKNSAPLARDDAAVTDEDNPVRIEVLANDSDKNGDALQIVALDGRAVTVGQSLQLASGAKVTLQADGSLSYDPNAAFEALADGQTASDSFTYRISDGRGGEAQATVRLTIDGVSEPGENRAPLAVNDSARTDEDTPVTGAVLANDSDPDGDPLTVVQVNGQAAAVGQTVTLASGALLTMAADGRYSYDPNGRFEPLGTGQQASDSFSYTVSDGRGGVAAATVTVTIDGITDTSGDPVPYYVEDLLLSASQRWNYPDAYGTPVTVSYAFLASVPGYYPSTDWAHTAFRPFTAQQEGMTRSALGDIEAYANIRFVEVADVAQAAITFGIADIPSYVGYAYYPSGNGINRKAGDVWIDSAYAGSSFTLGSAQYKTLIHEIGHAIGLDHPATLSGVENSRMYTVMSYNRHPTMSGEPVSHMPYDMATVQHIYGANTAARAGDDVYRLADLNNKILTIWDGGGNDTIDLGAATRAITLDLRAGQFSTVSTSGSNNIAIAFDTIIENGRTGSGDDILIGNAADNVLAGGAGNDRLTGSAGRDIFDFDAAWGQDTVTDFTRGVDRLDLLDTGLSFADLAIIFDGGGATVSDGTSRISLVGVTALGESDFLFALSA